MYAIKYGTDKRHIQDYLGVDIATGINADYTALSLVSRYALQVKVDDFPETFEEQEKYEVVEIIRFNDLDTDKQIKFLIDYIGKLDSATVCAIDATREISMAIAIKNALPNRLVKQIIWSGGSVISREGSRFVASKSKVLMDLRAMVSLGKITVPDIPLRDELRSEIMGFTFDESDMGGF